MTNQFRRIKTRGRSATVVEDQNETTFHKFSPFIARLSLKETPPCEDSAKDKFYRHFSSPNRHKILPQVFAFAVLIQQCLMLVSGMQANKETKVFKNGDAVK